MEIDKGLEWFLGVQKLTIVQAVLLIVELNPLICRFSNKREPENSDIYESYRRVSSEKTSHFRGAYNAIVQAGKEGQLEVEWLYDVFGVIDVGSSSVLVEDLKEWLLSRGQRPAFFFPEGGAGEVKDQKYAFQDPSHPRYAPKLAAVVAAWEVVREAAPSKSVKGTLIKWLREHAVQYKLVDDDNLPREKLIEELASVANWEPTGGAPPKTPAN
ncbi:hypothetical protein [Bartonella krasnovii]|uniref:Phage protein n=1 Tax=Bartonella krasnovii TaxID=2267275 RepID=A0ABY3VU18_9HYPH|nr:hypothetical protein [Bartonella krasnovii]UNF28877.1 hypothetical protein MNL13_06645 [Bartonella krasnovii]UNF35243.1 hypothetical protein MNL12_06610 [Bartonella krasnovii]UNF38557.1 hypothetical protein MNL10_07475 [Bartonella krasnovii]UNF40289.1 hypothetical protein MNL09_07600 [Bartonella krasnovii]UNF45212.1 hypothetical protein MNL06_06615 [Bartonella krasnovii]